MIVVGESNDKEDNEIIRMGPRAKSAKEKAISRYRAAVAVHSHARQTDSERRKLGGVSPGLGDADLSLLAPA